MTCYCNTYLCLGIYCKNCILINRFLPSLHDDSVLAQCSANDTGNLILNILSITSTEVGLGLAGLYNDCSDLASL